MISGRLGCSLRICPSSSLARATGHEEKASKFCDMMEKRDFLREQAVVSLGSVHISKILVPTVGWMV